MAKTYIDTVKYLVYAEIEIGGLVDKPDVVGAIFGQTEGLLGDDLDLRELQKNGRIGRIDVDLTAKGGKTFGIVKVPSSLDMVETSIIAASLEAVDRVGPCEGRVKVQRIEDTRNQKRKVLVERAKILLKVLLNTEIPESREISELVRDQVKTAEVTEFGFDKLSAGPGIDKLDEIIVVEGRADVINLLKNDISNVIAIGGAKVPKSIVELSKGREITVFLDGDRGGDIILNELIQGGVEIDFVARAPVGKEVEELTRKEIIKVLRSKTPIEQVDEYKSKPFAQPYQTPKRFLDQQYHQNARVENGERMERERLQAVALEQQAIQIKEQKEPQLPVLVSKAVAIMAQAMEQKADRNPLDSSAALKAVVAEAIEKPAVHVIRPVAQIHIQKDIRFERGERKEPREQREIAVQSAPKQAQVEQLKLQPEASAMPVVKKSRDALIAELDELNNTLKARLYSVEGALAREVPVRDVIKSIDETNAIETIVFDGIITQRLVDVASNKGVKLIIGVKQGNVSKKPPGIEIFTKSK